jgi:hypothetical protein
MRWLARRLGSSDDEREEWMATATGFAHQLTEAGARCHLNDGSTRFCHWRAEELVPVEPDGAPLVGVRCSVHPGGRCLDSDARLSPEDFAPTRG